MRVHVNVCVSVCVLVHLCVHVYVCIVCILRQGSDSDACGGHKKFFSCYSTFFFFNFPCFCPLAISREIEFKYAFLTAFKYM